MSDKDLKTQLDKVGVPPKTANAIVHENANARGQGGCVVEYGHLSCADDAVGPSQPPQRTPQGTEDIRYQPESRGQSDKTAVPEHPARQFELAGPRRPAKKGELVGTLPVHGGAGTRWGGSRCVEVRNQPRRIDGDQEERILQKLIKPTGGGGVLGRVFTQVAVLLAGVLGLAEEHVEQGTFVAGLVPRGEQLVGEGLVEQPGDRTGAALGRRGLEQVVSSRRTAQGIKIGDAGAVAEGGGEGEPGRVVQPGAAGVGERREQPAVAFPPLV